MKRRAPWQARRIATAKALRELPVCAYAECKKRGMGYVTVTIQTGYGIVPEHLWLCPEHAAAHRNQPAPRSGT